MDTRLLNSNEALFPFFSSLKRIKRRIPLLTPPLPTRTVGDPGLLDGRAREDVHDDERAVAQLEAEAEEGRGLEGKLPAHLFGLVWFVLVLFCLVWFSLCCTGTR